MASIRAMSVLFVACFGLCVGPDVLAAEMDDNEGFFAGFERRASATQSKQPGWAVPLFAPYSGLIQSIRLDFTRQVSTTGVETWNYGGGKGLNFIPLPNTQIDINFPAYHQRSSGNGDGAGDFAFGVKYRLLTANEKKGNYSVLLGIATTLPTGSYSNGASHAMITPNIAIGKGWGRFDVQTTASINLPTGNTSRLGRHVTWHTLGQLHVGKYFWPEIENTTIFYRGGANDGRVQNHILPGFMFGKIKFKPEDPKSRTGISVGAGMQFATTHFHVHDHMPIFSARFTF